MKCVFFIFWLILNQSFVLSNLKDQDESWNNSNKIEAVINVLSLFNHKYNQLENFMKLVSASLHHINDELDYLNSKIEKIQIFVGYNASKDDELNLNEHDVDYR